MALPMSDSPNGEEIRDNPERHRFEVDLGDGGVAIAEYTLPSGKMMFTHTEVPPEHEGKGIGSALIRHALDEARKRQLKVIPICPFFAAYMRNHAEVQDLLDSAWRKKFGLD
jgi:predicted GNAT family acetyltransferase